MYHPWSSLTDGGLKECYGKRSVGGQKKRFKDTIKNTLTIFNIGVTNWEVCAQDRPLRRSMIHTGARTAETNRIEEAQKKRAAETLLYHQRLSRPEIPMPRVWKSAAGQNWTDYPPPHPQGQPNMTSPSSVIDNHCNIV